jgi:hypothetical protein
MWRPLGKAINNVKNNAPELLPAWESIDVRFFASGW